MLLCPWDSPGKNIGGGCHVLFQGIFPDLGSNLGLLYYKQILYHLGFSGGSKGRVCLQCRRPDFNPRVGKIPWRRKWQPTSVFLPGKSHGRKSLAGYSQSIGLQRVERGWVTLLSLFFTVWAKDFPRGAGGKDPACQCRRHKICGFDPCIRKISWRRAQLTIPGFLPGESHGQRSLAGYSLWGHKKSDTTEQLITHGKSNSKRHVVPWWKPHCYSK